MARYSLKEVANSKDVAKQTPLPKSRPARTWLRRSKAERGNAFCLNDADHLGVTYVTMVAIFSMGGTNVHTKTNALRRDSGSYGAGLVCSGAGCGQCRVARKRNPVAQISVVSY
jgi:hypothetical protein